METSTQPPNPVVFKSLSKTEMSLKSHRMKCLTLEFHHPEDEKNGYYLLIADADPSRPIRLYGASMKKLKRQLVVAREEAKKLEQQQHLEENDHYDCGIIHSYSNMSIRLVLNVFEGKIYIWLRLYSTNENNEIIPTKTAVRFSQDDDIEAMGQFMSETAPF